MQMRIFPSALLFILFMIPVQALLSQEIRGKVVDAETGHPLISVSLLLERQKSGATTDTLGRFYLKYDSKSPDTLLVSYLGYKTKRVALARHINENLEIGMEAQSVVLEEVEVVPRAPTYYITEAMSRISENYNQNPYYLLSYFESDFYENKQLLESAQTVFKTYLKASEDPYGFPEEQHQLILHKQIDGQHKLEFMSKDIRKKIDKEQGNKSEEDRKFVVRITPTYVPMKPVLPFLDSKYYKKFKYKIREDCSKRNLIIIDFETKSTFSYNLLRFRGKGAIYLDCNNFAVVKIDLDMNVNLSFVAKTALFFAFKKLKVNDVLLKGNIEYKKKDAFWYPHSLTLYGSGQATKVNFFSKNEKAFFEYSLNIFVNKVMTDGVTPIEKEKQYSFDVPNVQNDMNLSWRDIITVSGDLHKN